MKNKTAIVTGSTSGIGVGIAHRLAAQGCNIVINGLGDADEIEALRASIETDFAVKCIYSNANMTKPDEIRGMVDLAHREFGSVDVLVNNAGVQHVSPIEDFDDDRWDFVIAINLSSAFHSMKAAIPIMRKQNFGRIINVASAHGHVASLGKAAYVASKHGILGMTKVVALETAEVDITANCICPGWVLTPLVKQQIETRAQAEGKTFEEAKDELLSEKQPSKQFATPEQIGDAAVFLSSEAASQITGTSINVDGGWTAQ